MLPYVLFSHKYCSFSKQFSSLYYYHLALVLEWIFCSDIICSNFKKFPEFADTVYRNSIAAVNKELYIDILCHLKGVVRRKWHEKWKTNSSLPIHGNAPTHHSVLVMDFTEKKKGDNTGASPILFWPGCIWFLPVPMTDMSIVMLLTSLRMQQTAEKAFKNGFQECFQHLYSHWNKCIIAQGEEM